MTLRWNFETNWDAERRFLIGLEKLTRETGVVIAGCGCCGSPSLETDQDTTHPDAGYSWTDRVQWVSPSIEHLWNDEDRAKVVREK